MVRVKQTVSKRKNESLPTSMKAQKKAPDPNYSQMVYFALQTLRDVLLSTTHWKATQKSLEQHARDRQMNLHHMRHFASHAQAVSYAVLSRRLVLMLKKLVIVDKEFWRICSELLNEGIEHGYVVKKCGDCAFGWVKALGLPVLQHSAHSAWVDFKIPQTRKMCLARPSLCMECGTTFFGWNKPLLSAHIGVPFYRRTRGQLYRYEMLVVSGQHVKFFLHVATTVDGSVRRTLDEIC